MPTCAWSAGGKGIVVPLMNRSPTEGPVSVEVSKERKSIVPGTMARDTNAPLGGIADSDVPNGKIGEGRGFPSREKMSR